MIDIEEENTRPETVFLVGKNTGGLVSGDQSLAELRSLASTAGYAVAGELVLKRDEPAPRFGMGTGKATEIVDRAVESGSGQILFDFEITPTQQRNWESLSGLTCLDRQEVIIRIFAQRAMTREAVLQVELARLEYALPRLAHTYEALSRQRGGRYGTKGAGETQLELDRRSITARIATIRSELKAVKRERANRRKRREKVPVPTCAIVGYTNAGKSSLLNALTGAGVLAEDKLFATLDPTTRRFSLLSGRTILLTDTVGFVRNLPHDLVEAFHATLEEAVFADAVLILQDASDRAVVEQLAATRTVLAEIGAADRPSLLVLNKSDLLDQFTRARLETLYPEAVFVSAKTQDGLQVCVERMDSLFSGTPAWYRLPADRHDLVALAYRSGSVITVQYEDTAVLLQVRSSGRLAAELKEFITDEVATK